MPAKTQIVDFLDDKALVLPALLDAAIVGNERAKYLLSLFQMAASYAEHPQEGGAASPRTDREACGITDTTFDRSVSESVSDGHGNFHIPGAHRLAAVLDDAMEAMLAPLTLLASNSQESAALHEEYRKRLDELVKARPTIVDDMISGETIASMTSGRPTSGERGICSGHSAGASSRHSIVSCSDEVAIPRRPPHRISRSFALDQNSTIIAVVELSHSSWLVAGMLPGIERQPHKKLEPSPERLLAVLHRWRDEAVRAGRTIRRIALAFEAGRDGFWLARWLAARGVEAHVIHPLSVAVSREHRRAKTDRLDTELLKRGFLGWLRGERGHCSMARVPTIAEEDAKRPNRERECLVGERTRIVNRIKAP